MLKHLKPYHLFEGISSDYNEDLDILKDILSELKIDYFEIDYLTFNQETHLTFQAMKDSIKKWEKTKSFKTYISPTPLIEKEIDQVIIARIERDDFYWKDVKEIVKESIHYMTHNGWKYIIEPVWKDTSMGYHLEEMKYFDNQKLDLLCIRFYC
jgi:hypothetical protein